MKPEEKAKELLEKFQWCTFIPKIDHLLTDEESKQCAFICVEEILEVLLSDINPIQEVNIRTNTGEILIGGIKFWQEVKQEIEKL